MKLTPDDGGGAALLEYVGGKAGVDDARAASVYVQALALVNRYIASVDAEALDEGDVAAITGCVYEVGSKLWQRRNAPNGQVVYGDIEGGAGMLAPRDPFVTAYPVLDVYVLRGLA